MLNVATFGDFGSAGVVVASTHSGRSTLQLPVLSGARDRRAASANHLSRQQHVDIRISPLFSTRDLWRCCWILLPFDFYGRWHNVKSFLAIIWYSTSILMVCSIECDAHLRDPLNLVRKETALLRRVGIASNKMERINILDSSSHWSLHRPG